jgi:predicted GNAT family acetyltransferase
VAIQVLHDRKACEFAAQVDGERAVLQYHLAAPVMTIVHTRVPAAIGSRGIAAELTRAALDAARAEGWKVVPACSYAVAFIRRHTEYADLLQVGADAGGGKKHEDALLDEAIEESFPASDSPSVGSSN